jgi:hypothetical protein
MAALAASHSRVRPPPTPPTPPGEGVGPPPPRPQFPVASREPRLIVKYDRAWMNRIHISKYHFWVTFGHLFITFWSLFDHCLVTFRSHLVTVWLIHQLDSEACQSLNRSRITTWLFCHFLPLFVTFGSVGQLNSEVQQSRKRTHISLFVSFWSLWSVFSDIIITCWSVHRVERELRKILNRTQISKCHFNIPFWSIFVTFLSLGGPLNSLIYWGNARNWHEVRLCVCINFHFVIITHAIAGQLNCFTQLRSLLALHDPGNHHFVIIK